MVRRIRSVLTAGPCTLSQIAAELGTNREIVRAAIRFWVDRGDVVVEPGRRVTTCEAGGCAPCGVETPGRPAVGPAVYRLKE